MSYSPSTAKPARRTWITPRAISCARTKLRLCSIRSGNILATSKTVLPESAAGKACSHTLALWPKLIRFLNHPQLELSNNLAENSMRPVAIGRKNWIHIGSQQAGPRVAAILSVVESCRRLKIPVRDYLGTILPGLANTPIQRVPELTPTAWIHSRTQS